jgi:hypothetical protein
MWMIIVTLVEETLLVNSASCVRDASSVRMPQAP